MWWLDRLHRQGHNVPRLIHRATSGRPLPAEHATAALGYRIQRSVRLQQQFDQTNSIRRATTTSQAPTLGL